MAVDSTFLHYFIAASPIVKIIMFLLLIASFWSWVTIFERFFYFREIWRNLKKFEKSFWQQEDLSKLYQEVQTKKNPTGLERIFMAGFREFARLKQKKYMDPLTMMEAVERAMDIARSQLAEDLEAHLPFLATVGSTSPYVGLFGTVWGIMTAFQALGQVEQATISMVAPGISEALIATAMGLFAAIPAVIAYNRYMNRAERILNRYEVFEDEFANYLYRQAHTE